MTSNAQAARDFAAAYAKRYPARPTPVVRQFGEQGGRFEIQEGWAKRTAGRQQVLRETADMLVAAATGRGNP